VRPLGAQVAIIGAGPYGLALAAHLREREIPFRIFGRTMQSWIRYMPEGMYLKSEAFASSIADPLGRYTLQDFCRRSGRAYSAYGKPVSIDVFAEYGLWFQQTVVPEVEETEVQSVRAQAGEYEIVLATGEIMRARRVVVAAGHMPYQYVPPELRDVPADRISHSADHRDFRGFEGKEIAVIGGGQSALETAALLREHGALPVVLVRKQSISWNDSPSSNQLASHDEHPRTRGRMRRPVASLGAGWRMWIYSELPILVSALPESTRLRLVREVLGPAGAWWLRDRVEGKIRILLGHSIVGVSDGNGKVRLRVAVVGAEETELAVDSLIAATGYRVSLDRLAFLDPRLQAKLRRLQGAPILSSSFESSVPGLYFVGLAAAFTFGPVMRFVCGTRFAARRVTTHVDHAQRPRRFLLGQA
jgi:cation diffusion facilitator CzcD-associated flavoprotein CzcO